MYFSHRTTAILVAAVASTQASPQMALSSITTVAPTIITGDKMGAATFADDYTSTMVVYQAADSSVQLLSGSGPPSSASSYASSVILAAGIARNDTPLALAVDNTYYNIQHLFYLSATECPGGNYLYELYNDMPFHGWEDGPLNTLRICSSSASNFLYAIGGSTPSTGSEPSSPIRVGYMRAGDGVLCEANDQSAGSWTAAQF